MISESFMHFVEYELQAIALTWMVVIYTFKAIRLSKLPMPWEKETEKGNASKGVLYSYASIFMPWSVESSRDHIWRWIGFALYHVGCLVAIVNTFTFTFTPKLMTPSVKIIFSILIAPALVVGFSKFIRRIVRPEIRHISTPDDYFSLLSLQLFFFTGIMALLMGSSLFWRSSYYVVTAAFLFYVPFSKISHYIYFFFARFLTGKRYGWRGIIPKISKHESSK